MKKLGNLFLKTFNNEENRMQSIIENYALTPSRNDFNQSLYRNNIYQLRNKRRQQKHV